VRAPLGPIVLALLVSCLGERPLGPGVGGSSGNAALAAGGGGDGGSGADVAGSSSLLEGGAMGGGDAGVVGRPVAPRLAFAQAVPPGYASKPLGPILVEIQDPDGLLLGPAEGTVTLTLGSNPGGANLIGYLTAPAHDGVAVFDTVGLDQVGEGYTLSASAAGLASATSPPFDVVRLPFERVTTGLYGGRISHVAASTSSGENANPSALYAAGPGGVFRSSNSGSTWAASNFGNPGAVGLVVIDPVNPTHVYTTPSFGSVSDQGSGAHITKSDDGGTAWRPVEALAATAPGAGQVGTLVIDPINPSILYAGNSAGVFRSTDAGARWVRTSFPFAADFGLTLDPLAPATLYAAAYEPSPSFVAHGLYKTIDGGNNWAPVNNPSLPPDILPAGPLALLATPTGVFIGNYRSTDGGASWTAIAGLSSPRAYAYAPSNVQRIYVAEGAFVRASNNGGETFGADSSPNALINSLAVDASNADRVYAATDSGVFVSTNAGVTWSSASLGITTPSLFAVAMDPANTDYVFAGGLGGVYVTSDGGITWRYTELGSGVDEVTALAVDPLDAATVYACTAGALLHRSDNRGMSWGPGIDTGGAAFCDGIAVSGATLWLPTAGGIRRSTNGGADWELDSRLDLLTYSVAVAPDGTTLYASSDEGTHKSVNSGVSWTSMTTDFAEAFLVDPSTPSTVYMGLGCGSNDVATSAGGIRRSTDSGGNWEPAVGTACITALLGLADGRVLALGATPMSLPFFAVSSDHGLSWQTGGLGIEGQATGFARSADGNIVYVATTLGLYRAATGGL